MFIGAVMCPYVAATSRAIDWILVEAIYDGAGMNLKDGLDLECRLFRECITTGDMHTCPPQVGRHRQLHDQRSKIQSPVYA